MQAPKFLLTVFTTVLLLTGMISSAQSSQQKSDTTKPKAVAPMAAPPGDESYEITGPTSVETGWTRVYYASPDMSGTVYWEVDYGVGTVSNTSVYACNITWNTTGTHEVRITDGLYTLGSLYVTVSAALSGGTISNASHTLNYNTAPSQLTASAASGGGCGGAYSYQWQQSSDNVNFSNISGANAQNYQPGSLNATTYYRRQTSCGGNNVYTNVATVTVYSQLVLSGITPSSQTLNYDGISSTLSLSGLSGGSGTYSYLWEAATAAIGPYNTVSTYSSYSPGAMSTTTYYRVTVTSNCISVSATSTTTVLPQISAGTLAPSSQTIISGTSPSSLTVIGVSGGNGVYTYIWQSATSVNGSFTTVATHSAISSGTDSYSPGGLTADRYYRVLVNSNGAEATSATVYVQVNAALSGGSISGNTGPINYNSSPGTFTGTAASGGICGSYSYQWQLSTNGGSTYTDISGETGANYTSGNLNLSVHLRRRVQCGSETMYSNVLSVSVYPVLQLSGITPSSQSINCNASAGSLSLMGLSGGSGSYTYLWEVATSPGGSYSSVGTGSTYSPGVLSATRYYRATVTSNGVSVSATASVLVYPQLIAGTINPSSQTILTGTAPGTLTLSGVSGGTGTYTYSWRNATAPGGPYSEVSAQGSTTSTGSTYSPGILTATRYYEVQVQSNGVTVSTSRVTVTVNPLLSGGTISGNTGPIGFNTAPGLLTGSTANGGLCGSYAYLWQTSQNGTVFTNIGMTDQNYTPGYLTTTTYYRRMVTCGNEVAYSNVLQIQVGAQLTAGTLAPASITVTSGTSPGTLTAGAPTGGNCGSYTYKWQSSTNGISYTDISPVVNSLSYSPGTLTSAVYYRLAIICGSETRYTNPCFISIGTPYVDMNYIRTRDLVRPGITTKSAADALTNVADVRQQTQYMDGLSRLAQTVVKQGSNDNKDLVQPVSYDVFGRVVESHLPYVSTAGDGLYRPNALQGEQTTFNNALYPDENGFVKGITRYEYSPLNRVTESFAPGKNWAGTAEEISEVNRRSVKKGFYTNTIADSVRIWNVTTSAMETFSTYTSPGIYPAGALVKTIVADEHNKQVVEFTDKEGRVILKKVQQTAIADTGSGKGHYGWLCTYYLYDVLGNLRCVVQPKGIDAISSNWILTNSTILSELCFRYEYDERNRMIIKKVPGAGETYMVYDARNRMIMAQDAGMRSATPKRWVVTKYDDLNRIIETGLLANSSSFSSFRDSASTSLMIPSITTNYTQWTYNHYDDYTGLPAGMNGNFNDTLSGEFLMPGYSFFAQPLTSSSQLKGLPTWTKVAAISSTLPIYTVNVYDDKGRVIQVKSKNFTGGNDLLTTQYSWNGLPLITMQRTQKAGTKGITVVTVTKYIYDDLSRLVRLEKKIGHSQINGGALPSVFTPVAEHTYDNLGQLKTKKLAPDYNNGEGLETLNYDYTIRGWLLGANRDYLKDTSSQAHYFGFDLGYDKTVMAINAVNAAYASPQFNGNINGMLWKSTGDDQLRKYDFSYDAANRLTNANFNEFRKMQFDKSGGIDFSLTGMTYDANGNILTMNQKGLKGVVSQTIDSLLYTYLSQTNKLRSVIDRVNDTTTKLGDFRSDKQYMDQLSNNKTTGATDYTYNANGSLARDLNKSIIMINGGDGIQYNWINLPVKIHFKKDNSSSKGTIDYSYSADGTKLRKIVTEFGVDTVTTLYLGNAIFTDDSLSFFGMEEGRVRRVNSSFVYDYFIKDHLGNVRMVLTDEQKQDAYPAATMETAASATEELFYANLSATRVDKPSGYPVDTSYSNPNNKVAKVKGDGNRIGPAILLKVMAGDKFNVRANAWWSGSGSGVNTNPLTDIVAALITGAPAASAGKVGAGSLTSSLLNPEITTFLSNQPANGSKPKAYLNWILFDEQFKLVAANSSAEVVGDNGEYKTFNKTNMPVNKNGYLYIYTSNETNVDVFFDNLQVTHVRGSLLEESHYYPFGLTMAGISSKALAFGEPKNKEQTFQGQRFDDELDLNWVQFKWRNHDPQIGRFLQIDPLAEEYVHNSTYAFSENKVTTHVELEGLEASWFGYGQHVPQDQWQGFHQGLNEGLRKGATPQIVAAGVVLSLMFPQIAGPILAAEIFGVPSPTRPTSMASSLAGETAVVASEMSEIESLATKARIFEAGGEIGMMDGAATLTVNPKSGYFNMALNAGSEKAILSGEIIITDNAITFADFTVKNAKSSSILGAIDKQGSIGLSTFNKLQKEMTELTKAGGYNKATIEFEKLRPDGSPLPDMEKRVMTLFDNTQK